MIQRPYQHQLFLKFAIVLWVFVSGSDVSGQAPYVKRIHLNTEKGDVKFLRELRDKKGMLWFGSSEGVIEFDGKIHTLHALKTPGFDNTVSSLYEDHGDTIWIGYKSGQVAFLTGQGLQLFNPREGMPKKPVTAISKDSYGNLWIATAGEGIYFYEDMILYNINTDDGLNDNYAYALAPADSGSMWVGTDEGLVRCMPDQKKKVIEKFHIGEGLPDNIVRVIVPLKNGDLWIGLQQKGVCRYIAARKQFVVSAHMKQWPFGQVNSICADKKGLWIGTEESGLVFAGENELPVSYMEFNSLHFSRVSDVIKDLEGNLWMLANSNIYQSPGNRVMILDKVPRIDMKMVHTLMADSKGKIWFTPDQGLVAYSGGDATSQPARKYTITPEKDLVDIVSLYEDDCHYIWVGTMGAGIYRLNPETGAIRKITASPLLHNASVMAIAGSGNTVYAATFSGAIRITIPEDCHSDEINPLVETLDKDNLLGSFYIYDVFIDSKKRIWFATDGKGIICFENGAYTSYNGKQGIAGTVIYSITEDESGNIWFSTQEHGLYKFDGTEFSNINDSNGLSSLVLSGIIADRKGSIVAVHNHGFDVLNISTGNFRYYGAEVGFTDINSDLNAITRDSKGQVWIGTDQAIIKYTGDDRTVPPRPVTLITKAAVYSNEIISEAERTLSHDENYLSFDFTGLWYTNPNRVKFQYMLEGYNKEWISTLDRHVIFPKLEPGTYRFRVRSSLTGNFTEFTEASYAFRIRLPVWREGWFIFMAAVITGTVVYLLAQMRIRQIRKLEELKKEKINFQFETLKSQVNPHFLFNSFNTLITIIEEDKKNAIEFVETLSSFFRNIVTFKDHDLITLQEELGVASVYFYLQQKRYGNNLRLKVQVSDEAKKKKIPPLVLQMLMENAVKHNAVSSETPLDISITSNGSSLVLTNNINVKRTVEHSTRTGLQNILNRFRLLTNQPVVISHTATSFSVTIPLI